MTWTRRWPRSSAVAAAGLLASAAVAGWSLRTAIERDPLPTMTPAGEPHHMPSLERRAPSQRTALRIAVASDPFRPERRPPAVPFRLPGEKADAVPDTPPGGSEQEIKLIGTAVLPGGGFAMCQRAAEPAKLVRIGEALGGYTLKAVTRGRAVFTSASGSAIELRVPKVGS